MAARVPLVKSGSATSGPTSNGLNQSIQIRLADPPYIWDAPGTGSDGVAWTGSILIQATSDTQPAIVTNNGYMSNSGVSDANARWETIGTLTPTSGPIDWQSPLYRIRANTSGVTGGHPDVYHWEGIRSLKMNSSHGGKLTSKSSAN